MEIHQSQEVEIPIPIPLNSTYGGHSHVHMMHHESTAHNNNHIIQATSSSPPMAANNNNNGPTLEETYKKMVKYRECLKNHAASMGGNATDGCGEFMPSGEEGTLEALTCSACNCHRNFHRKEIEGEISPSLCENYYHNPRMPRKYFLGHHPHKGILGQPVISSRPHQMIMSYNMGVPVPSESDEQEEGGGGVVARQPQLVKKRFRTKFTQEQKEKMLNFAEKVGWKIQKQEEGVVQQFCQEVGVKRRVLKVWMHNNKHNLAKKNLQSSSAAADQNPV